MRLLNLEAAAPARVIGLECMRGRAVWATGVDAQGRRARGRREMLCSGCAVTLQGTLPPLLAALDQLQSLCAPGRGAGLAGCAGGALSLLVTCSEAWAGVHPCAWRLSEGAECPRCQDAHLCKSTVSFMHAAPRGRAVLSCTSAWRAFGAVCRRRPALSGRARAAGPSRGTASRARCPSCGRSVSPRCAPCAPPLLAQGPGGAPPASDQGLVVLPASTPAVWRCPAPAAPRCYACLRAGSALAPARVSARGRLPAQAAAQPGADGELTCGLGRKRQLPGPLPNVRVHPAPPPGTVSVRSPAARRAPTPCVELCVCVSATPQPTLWYPASARA